VGGIRKEGRKGEKRQRRKGQVRIEKKL